MSALSDKVLAAEAKKAYYYYYYYYYNALGSRDPEG